jgi:RND family efflux transporter MFP subunit
LGHLSIKPLVRIRTCSVFAAAVLMGLVTSGCSHPSADEGAEPMVKAEVTLTRVARADIAETVALTGTAAALPNQDVRVSSLVAGRIEELKVAEGDRVQAGELVARIDDRPYRDQLKQAEAAAQQAKANEENARLTLARNEDLFKRGIAARKDLEDARTQQSVAAAGEQQAEAALELVRLQLARTQIASPLSGQVAKRFVNVGEQVDGTAAQPIVEIANLHELEFLGSAPAMYLAKLHAGQTVEVTTEAVPGEKFAGRVVAISPAVDPSTGTGVVRIRVPNPKGLLRLGVFLNAQVPVETHAQALVVPSEAIYRDQEGNPRVFVVNQEMATAVKVKLGIESKGQVELLAGVREGETLIRTGGYGLGDAAQIQVSSR